MDVTRKDTDDRAFDLERFVVAQDACWTAVQTELRQGCKTSHWMWFVFPQLAALGRSSTARHFGIADLAEAKAYARHPVLGPRLTQSVELVIAAAPRDVHAIFGSPDDMKFRSSVSLFAETVTSETAGGTDVFRRALDTFFDGEPDQLTLRLLHAS